MASFPRLKTGAVAQYPSDRARRFATDVHRFLDGKEQRFAAYGSPLKIWTIRLDELNDTEMAELESFFLSQNGTSGHFTFTDPWDGTDYTDCSFDRDMLSTEWQDIHRGQTSVVIQENR